MKAEKGITLIISPYIFPTDLPYKNDDVITSRQ